MRWRPIYLPFMLKPIRATIGSFNQLKLVEFQQRFLRESSSSRFFLEQFFPVRLLGCWLVCAIFLEQKRGHAGLFFWIRKQGVLGVFFLEQKISSGNSFVAAEQPDLYADWVRSSSICFLI